MRAPWWRTCCSTRARPRPEPSPLVDSRRAKGAKIRSRSASAMPGPSSSTVSRAPPSSPGGAAASVTRTWPWGRPWRTAFSTRLSASSRSPGSQPSIATGVSGSSRAEVAGPGGARRPAAAAASTTSARSTSRELERPGVAAGQGLQAVEELDEAPLLGQRVADHLRAALGREVEVALERGQRGLHAGQRRAQLVPRVGGEAPRRGQGARAIGGRAPEAREHGVEARRQRAQLGRPARAARAGRGPRPRRRSRPRCAAAAAGAARGRRPARRRRQAASQGERPRASSRRSSADWRCSRERQRRHDLQAREAAEALVVQRGDVGAIALPVRREGLQPALQARALGRRRAGVEQDRRRPARGAATCRWPRGRRRGACRSEAARR